MQFYPNLNDCVSSGFWYDPNSDQYALLLAFHAGWRLDDRYWWELQLVLGTFKVPLSDCVSNVFQIHHDGLCNQFAVRNGQGPGFDRTGGSWQRHLLQTESCIQVGHGTVDHRFCISERSNQAVRRTEWWLRFSIPNLIRLVFMGSVGYRFLTCVLVASIVLIGKNIVVHLYNS